MSHIKITPLGAPPEPVPEPKPWPLKRLVQVTAYVTILTLQTMLLPFPFDALASIGLFVLTLLGMMIAERLNKASASLDRANGLLALFRALSSRLSRPKAAGTLMDEWKGSAR